MNCVGVINGQEIQPEIRNKLGKYAIKVRQVIIEEHIEKLIGLLFIEESAVSIAESCVRFLHYRKQLDGFIWVMANGVSQATRQMYFELGADGVFDGNCSIDEIVLCVKNSLERQQFIEAKYKKKLEKLENVQSEAIMLDRETRVIKVLSTIGWQEIILTETEFHLMDLLYQNIGMVCFYEQLYDKLWSGEMENREIYLANLVFRIRMKFKHQGVERAVIETVRSKGYRLLP